ncbi:hypothetical protein [Marinomonas rhizomae]|nr:hypothetical protein [Marinomonas rhizomae]
MSLDSSCVCRVIFQTGASKAFGKRHGNGVAIINMIEQESRL